MVRAMVDGLSWGVEAFVRVKHSDCCTLQSSRKCQFFTKSSCRIE